MSHLYKKIRAKKAIWEHEEVKNVIPFISEQLYSSKTQLIFELIQNAEDACIRLKRKGVNQKYFIYFNLKPKFLKVYHNGIPFDDKDVESICSVLQGTKTEDESLIGKFGIGFKSVYQYTTEPSIHSNNSRGDDHYFCIKKFVNPYKIQPSSELNEDQTLIEIPFNHPQKKTTEANKEIGEKLRNLNSRSILFLKCISEITYSCGLERGLYKRNEVQKKGYKEITLVNKVKDTTIIENWLLFEKHIDDNPLQPKVEIAFLISEDKKIILPIQPSKLYSYFETEKNTNLLFLIHGPFHTTPSRDNIRPDDWNFNIIDEISNLLAETIKKIKTLGYLDISFIRTLPLNPESFDSTVFEPIYYRVKKEMLNNEYFPIYEGGYSKPSNIFLAQISQLRELLSTDELLHFYKKKGNWLDEDITERRTPILRQYLINELDVPEITPDSFGRILTTDNLLKISDEWLVKLYSFLIPRQNLWQIGTNYQRVGAFRDKPIFRTSTNRQTAAFDLLGNPLVYLPSDSVSSSIPTIKEYFMGNHVNVDFFRAFGIKQPDKTDYIITNILPKYDKSIVPKEENIDDVYTIYDTIAKLTIKRKKDELLTKIKESKILYAKNSLDKVEYKKPSEIYLSEYYTSENYIETFYDGFSEAWFLSDRYSGKIPVNGFIELGVNANILVSHRTPDIMGYVKCSQPWSDHMRGVDRFDPDAQIHGLNHILTSITLIKSQILWNLLKQHKYLIYGIVEKSSRQDYKYCDEIPQFSKMGQLLTKNDWLPDSSGVFFRPSEIRLTELHDRLEKSSSDSKFISVKLHMKQEIDEEILSNMSDTQKNLLQTYHMLSEEKQNEVLSYMQKLAEEDDDKPLPPVTVESVEEIREKFADRISSEDDKSLIMLHDEVFPVIMTQEDEETLINNYGKNMGHLLHGNVMRYQNSMKNEAVVVSRIPPKQYLISEYEGYCQICGTKLDLGKTKNPIIEIFRIQERRKRHPWADEPWNILGLCPNCHALAKYGGLNLQSLARLANNIIIQEATSEYIDERKKQGYLMDITLATNSAQLFYTQRHMSYIAAFLFYDK